MRLANRNTPRGLSRRRAGFTLVELLITVAVIGILSSIALPSYRSYIRGSVRSEAQAYLLAVAARQQQFLVDTRGYAASLTATGIATPANVAANYTLDMPTPGTAPPTFSVTATPKGDQVADKCGTLSLDQAGAKTAAKSGCW